MTKPPVTNTNHILPFGELSPVQFERLCLWLVEREGYMRPQHLGEAGSEQGRDVVAYRATNSGEQLWYFQCKRYQTLGAPKLIEEVEKYNQLVKSDPTKKPFGIVFVTNATISADAREKVRSFCTVNGYESEFWARTELDMLVKNYSDVVLEFFDLAHDSIAHIQSKRTGDVNIHGDARGVMINIGADSASEPLSKPPLPGDRISIARLPTSGRELFGRDAELKMLDDAWEDPMTNIITFIAWGGVGKTALVNHWLKQRMARDNYRGAERIYAWSFYSQGTSDQGGSGDLFIDQALRWFGDSDATAGSPWDKGERLASYIRQTRTLLILDGLEPLQYPPGPQEGSLKDPALQAMLVELAAHQPGLCVISTRERVSDLVEFEEGTVVQHDLEQLSPQAGAQILRSLNVKGYDEELEEASRELDGHAFSLTLLGSYLDEVLDGDIRRRREIENLFDDTRHGDKAQKMIAAYEKWLGEGMELSILRLLGLFDRPADLNSIVALRESPGIVGLTEPLQHFKGREWSQAVAKLRRIKLLAEASPSDPGTLDAHPLIREHFKQQLKRERPDAWREGNNRLYEHLKGTAKEFPDTVEEMSPLYAAVAHGCAAGRHQEALNEVLRHRIMRRDEFFSTRRLGTFGAELAAMSGFFEVPWNEPVSDLANASKASLIGQAGFYLRAMGRMSEAAQPLQTALQAMIAKEAWKFAAIAAGNLSELYLNLGNLPQAIKIAQQGVELADRSDEITEQRDNRANLADALHQAGRSEEATVLFRKAEELQRQDQPEFVFLYSSPGFFYCDLLLGQGHVQEVKERAARTLEWAKQHFGLLSNALDHLSLGRASLIEAQRVGRRDDNDSMNFLQHAVVGLRQAGVTEFLPHGLLARAQLHRFNRTYDRAERDLAEVVRIAARSGMGLHLADYHLESARLRLSQGDKDKTREHLATAKEMIERMGYHRRDKEVNELEQQLGKAGTSPKT